MGLLRAVEVNSHCRILGKVVHDRHFTSRVFAPVHPAVIKLVPPKTEYSCFTCTCRITDKFGGENKSSLASIAALYSAVVVEQKDCSC